MPITACAHEITMSGYKPHIWNIPKLLNAHLWKKYAHKHSTCTVSAINDVARITVQDTDENNATSYLHMSWPLVYISKNSIKYS